MHGDYLMTPYGGYAGTRSSLSGMCVILEDVDDGKRPSYPERGLFSSAIALCDNAAYDHLRTSRIPISRGPCIERPIEAERSRYAIKPTRAMAAGPGYVVAR